MSKLMACESCGEFVRAYDMETLPNEQHVCGECTFMYEDAAED